MVLGAAGLRQGLRFMSIVTVAGALGTGGLGCSLFPTSDEGFEPIILMSPVRRRSPEGGIDLRRLTASA